MRLTTALKVSSFNMELLAVKDRGEFLKSIGKAGFDIVCAQEFCKADDEAVESISAYCNNASEVRSGVSVIFTASLKAGFSLS